MAKKRKLQKYRTIHLVIALVVVVLGGVLFVGAAAGWFDNPQVKLDAEYYSVEPSLIDIVDAEEYERLVGEGKSFVMMVDQNGCTTADRLRGYVELYGAEAGIAFYKMMFSEVKNSSLHEYIKYYPSVVVVKNGRPYQYLRADSDEDADKYNDYEAFRVWLGRYVARGDNEYLSSNSKCDNWSESVEHKKDIT